MAGAEEMLRQALAIDAGARQDPLLPGHRAQEPRALRRGARRTCETAAVEVPARSRRAEPARTGAVPAAAIRRSGRALKRVLAIDPEDLQAHYNLMLAIAASASTSWRRARRRSTGASRRTSRRRRSPGRIASSTRTTTTSGSRSTSTYGRAARHADAHAARLRGQAASDGSNHRRRSRVPWLVLGGACRGPRRRRRHRPALTAAHTFTDVTDAPASASTTQNGAFGKKYLPETMGAGGAFLDADGDGGQDILLVNAMTWPGGRAPKSLHGALPEQRRRHVHRRHRQAGPRRCRSTASASRPATTTTTAVPTSTSPRSARTACSATSAACASQT